MIKSNALLIYVSSFWRLAQDLDTWDLPLHFFYTDLPLHYALARLTPSSLMPTPLAMKKEVSTNMILLALAFIHHAFISSLFELFFIFKVSMKWVCFPCTILYILKLREWYLFGHFPLQYIATFYRRII
uniref:Uncharacterized protein n=1 Tax=Arundo donax TaxID=35708 RepID=A0A0A9E209_ARUDO